MPPPKSGKEYQWSDDDVGVLVMLVKSAILYTAAVDAIFSYNQHADRCGLSKI